MSATSPPAAPRLDRRREAALSAAAVALGAFLALRMALRSGLGGDYRLDAQSAIDALAAWDLDRFFASPALMGPLSLYLRAPFVAAFGGGEVADYRAGLVPCMVAAVAAAAWLAVIAHRRGQGPLAIAVAAFLITSGPVIDDALNFGHPEEILGGALAVAAVLAAVREQSLLAAVLLGLAVATKQWAVVAGLPVLVALPGGRVRAGAIAVGVFVALSLPQVLGNLDAYADSTRFAADATTGSHSREFVPAKELTIWWPLLDRKEILINDGVETISYIQYTAPDWLRRGARPLVVLIGFALGLLYLWRRPRRPAVDAMGLLALLFLLRCLFDPYTSFYYHVPFFMAVAAWEALAHRGLPVVSALSALACWVTAEQDLFELSRGDAFNAAYLAWSVPTAVVLAVFLFGPDRLTERMRAALGGRLPADQPSRS